MRGEGENSETIVADSLNFPEEEADAAGTRAEGLEDMVGLKSIKRKGLLL